MAVPYFYRVSLTSIVSHSREEASTATYSDHTSSEYKHLASSHRSPSPSRPYGVRSHCHDPVSIDVVVESSPSYTISASLHNPSLLFLNQPLLLSRVASQPNLLQTPHRLRLSFCDTRYIYFLHSLRTQPKSSISRQ